MRIKLNRYALIGASLIFLIVVTATGARLWLASQHFGHIDDLGVATTILAAESHPPTAQNLEEEAADKIAHGQSTPRVKALLSLTKMPMARTAIDLFSPIYSFISVPLTWTYAPIPMLATPILLEPGQHYTTIKFLGRLPSVFFSIVAMLIIVDIGRSIWPASATTMGLILLPPLAFSQEATIAAAQMFPYAATIATAAALLWLVARDASALTKPLEQGFFLRRLIILALIPYFSYQAVLLLPGYLALVILGVLWPSPRIRIHDLVRPALLCIGTIVAILPAYFFRIRTTAAIGWNAGPNGEFVFHPTSPLAAVPEAGSFIIRNGWICLGALFSPDVGNPWVTAAVTATLLVTAATAIVTMIGDLSQRRLTPTTSLCIAASTSLAVLIVLVLAGKLALAPTRHLLLYAPVVLVLAGVGFARLIMTAPRLDLPLGASPSLLVATIWTACLGLTFFSAFSGFVSARRDPFDERQLTALARQVNADVVVGYGSTLQPLLMPELAKAVPTISLSAPSAHVPNGVHRILYLSHRRDLEPSDCQILRSRMAPKTPIPQPCGQLTTLEKHPSEVEVEATTDTKNGTNGLFATLSTIPD